MTDTEQHTLVFLVKYDRLLDENLDEATERLGRILSRVTGVAGTTCVDARPLDLLRSEMRAVLSDGSYQAERALHMVHETLDQTLPALVDEAFKRGAASMLFPLNQEVAFARGEVAECLRLAAQATYLHRGIVLQDPQLQQLAGEFAGLLDVLTGVMLTNPEERASQHLAAINRVTITGEVPEVTDGLDDTTEAGR